MTPAVWLGGVPEYRTLVHEIGHIVTGLAVGVREHQIEFLKPGLGEVARAGYSRLDLQPRAELPRILGGMYCQARVCPSTIEDGLLRNLLDLTLFAEPASVRSPASALPVMERHGFQGDWRDFFSVLTHAFTAERRQGAAKAAHANAASVFAERDFAHIIPACIKELLNWFGTPDENLPYSEHLFYPTTHIGALLDHDGPQGKPNERFAP